MPDIGRANAPISHPREPHWPSIRVLYTNQKAAKPEVAYYLLQAENEAGVKTEGRFRAFVASQTLTGKRRG